MTGYVCEGRCPVCGRRVRLTWQRTGEVDACPCGMEAVLVVETKDLLRWYWRDSLRPEERELAPVVPVLPLAAGPVQLKLVE